MTWTLLPLNFRNRSFGLPYSCLLSVICPGTWLFPCPLWLLKAVDFPDYRVSSRLISKDQTLEYWRRLSRKQKSSWFFLSLETNISVQLGNRVLSKNRMRNHRNWKQERYCRHLAQGLVQYPATPLHAPRKSAIVQGNFFKWI